MSAERERKWVQGGVDRICDRLEREIAALVDVSSPSSDVAAAESVIAVACALLPEEAQLDRPTCSSPDHADDLLATLRGAGSGRLLLLGHLDTVISHADHHAMRANGERLEGPGTIDMKGGVAIAIGVLRRLAESPELYGEVALLLVVDEEWRRVPFHHSARFEDYDACLCFEAGERTAEGTDAVVVRRKAAGTIEVEAEGVAAHSGSNPDGGRNALLALAEVSRRLAAGHDPDGPDQLTVVPTVLNAGTAFNVVPGAGELYVDSRASRLGAIEEALEGVPDELDGVRLRAQLGRRWPAMDMIEASREALERAGEILGRPIAAAERGGASDASYVADGASVLAIDGLGPIGAGSHAPDEHLLAGSLRPRTEVALAIVAAILGAA